MVGEITKDDVVAVLDHDVPRSIVEITSRVHRSGERCSECDRLYNSFYESREAVSGVLKGMLMDGEVVPTEDWDWKLPDKS